MIGAVLPVVGRVTEVSTTEGSASGAPAWALGLLAFAILMVLLFTVTRLNRDR